MQAHSATIIDDLTDLTAVYDWQLEYSNTVIVAKRDVYQPS